MSTKVSSESKNKTIAQQKAKAETISAKKISRSLQEVVGPEVYRTWVSMLHELVPDGRTHRLAPLIAAMLQYALIMAGKKRGDEIDDDSIVQSLIDSAEVSDPSEAEELLHDAVTQLFRDSRVEYRRTSARGERYSISEEAYSEYLCWFDMPWEQE
jgi:hypothetical protein